MTEQLHDIELCPLCKRGLLLRIPENGGRRCESCGHEQHLAEVRCMFCLSLQGYKDGFHEPGLSTHGIGECCREFAEEWMKLPKGGIGS